MKTNSKRFLKGSLAVLLAVIMLFSTCITGFAAVVDVADTSYNVSANTVFYFDNTYTNFTSETIQLMIGHSGYSRGVKGTKIANTNLYRMKETQSWGDATQFSIFGVSGSSAWGGENNNINHRKNWAAESTNTYNLTGDYNGTLILYTTESSPKDLVPSYQGSSTSGSTSYNYVDKPQTAYVYGAAAGSSSYTESKNAGTVKVSGYHMTGETATSANSASSTLNSTSSATVDLARSSTVTLTATPADGYNFVGWFTSASGGTAVSTNTTYTYLQSGAASTTHYARFQQAGYSYTVTAGTGGTASPASGTGTSVDITAEPNDGYEFAGWEVTGGSVAVTSDPTTTFTITEANANAHATFAPQNYTVELKANGGTINSGNVTGYTYGDTVTLPTNVTKTGHTFAGWYDNSSFSGSPVTSITATTFGDKTYYAKWNINKYTITVNQNIAGGTTNVGGTTVSGTTGSAQFDYGTQVSVTVTPTGNYKINAISGAISSGESTAAVTKTFTVTKDDTINVNFALAGSCSVSFAKGTASQSLVIGGTYTNAASTDDTYCKGNGSVTYSSDDTSVASVSSSGVVTANKPGTATITATCKTDTSASASYQVTVLEPTLTFDEITLDVNGTADADDYRNIGYTPASSYSVTYTPITEGDVRITSAGAITAKAPTTGVNVTAQITCGSWSKTVTFPVSVNEVTLNFNPKAVNLIAGQTMTQAFTASASGYAGNAPTITITSGDTGVMTIGNDNKGTAVGDGSTTITATFKFNDYFTDYATSNVLVDVPVVELPDDFTSLNLEFGGGTTVGTVQLSTNAAFSDVEAAPVTVTTANANVATATIDADGKVTVTATGVGTTTVTAKFYDAEVEIPVTVTQYDPYEYIYVTDTQGWAKMAVYASGGGYSTSQHINMIYIGRNESDQRVFAYRFEKTKLPDLIIFKPETGSWTNQTVDINYKTATTNAWWINAKTADNNSKWTVGTWDCPITLPTVSVDNVVVPVGSTATANATSDGASYKWSIDNTNTATVADVTTATATVTGVTPGETTITARAFIATPTGWKSIASDQSTAYPYISSTATATVTVGSVDYEVSVNAETGGTAKITVGGVDEGTSATIAHGTEYTLTATANDGYRFLGWYNGETEVTTQASYTTTAKAAATYTAKFVKTYKVSVLPDSGIELVKLNNVASAEGFTDIEVDEGATITVYASPAENYAFTNWTDANDSPVSSNVTYTINNVSGNIVLTANAVPVYTASAIAQTNKYFGTYGGTVTIDGQSSPVQYKAGETVTFQATPNTNYYFDGWYSDAEFTSRVSSDAEYQTTMTEAGVTLYGLFVKQFYLTSSANERLATFVYNVAENSYSVTADYTDHFTITSNDNKDVTAADVNVTGGTHTGCSVAGHYTSYQVTPDTENYDIESPVTYTLTPDMNNQGAADGTYTMNITLSDAEKVVISVNGTKVADKAIRSTFSYEITAPAGQYLASAVTTPSVDFEIVDGKIEFTVPNSNVNIVPTFANYAYVEFAEDTTTGLTITGLKTGYEAGEEISIAVAPASEQVTIRAIEVDNDALTVTPDGNGGYTITGTLASGQTVTVTPTVDAKFMMDYGMVAIGNYGSGYTTYGTVAMAIGDTALAKGGYADKTETVTYTATPNSNFIFDGWYSDPSCSQGSLLSRNTSYDVTPTEDTTIYALFVPKHYIAEDQANVANHQEMTYDPATRSFKYTTSTLAKGAWFRVSNNPTTSAWTDSNSYAQFDSSFSVNFNDNAYLVTVGWGTQCYALTSDSSAEYPYTVIVTLENNSSIDVSCQAARTGGGSIYLSSGRLDLPGSYNATVFEATSTFTHEGVVNPTDVYVANEGENREKYKKLAIGEPQTVTFETEITGSAAANYYIDKYVVYHIDTETYTIVTPTTLGNNKYSGSVYVEGSCYIVPIYFLTEEYAADNDLVQIDIYFDATQIMDKRWGPFVACYSWGTGNVEYSGGWSGQMMIPTEDGSSFYSVITVPSTTNESAGSKPVGVTFNNYTQSTVPGSNPGAFGISATQYQCYDYREPITLYEEGYEVITFVAKESTDGYHGDRANGVTVNTVTTTTTDIFNKYEFDYLYSRDGKTPMDLNGDEIANYVDITTAKADYYIIAKGDITYDPNGTQYSADNNFDADWAVDWYVFDSNGTYKAHILSDALYNVYNEGDGTTYLEHALGLTHATAAGKTIAISYEHENNAGHQISYDGQWYGSMLDHTVTANVLVGIIDGEDFIIDNEDPTNVANYGEGWLIAQEEIEGITVGEKYAELEISLDLGEVALSAINKEGYRFDGWYTLVNGKYTKISPALAPKGIYLSNDTTYYAMFKQIGDDEVVISHSVYNNPNDAHIPSHGGVSQMTVEVYDSQGNLVVAGTPSTTVSTAVFEPVFNSADNEYEKYTVRITTTPLLNGEFFAWYTDSEDADGNATYEEVLVEAGMPGSTNVVRTEFEYQLDSNNPVRIVNIYSDVTRVSNKADFFYKYRNRFGQVCTYTVRDIPLTDDECFGYAGNGGEPYYPTYLTKYTMEDKNGNEAIVYGDELYQDYLDNGYQMVDSYNMVHAYAPSAEVTEAFDQDIKWVIEGAELTPSKSMVTLWAVQADNQYTVSCTYPDPSKNYEVTNTTFTGYYNELIQVHAPLTKPEGGEILEFSYWMNVDNGQIVSFSPYYNYRVIENLTIEAIYGEEVQEWLPAIEEVTYTREFQDTSDKVYVDFFLAFHNKEGKVLNDVKEDEGIKYGLIMVYDHTYNYDGNGDVQYLDLTDRRVDLEKSAKYGQNAVINGTRFYNFDLTGYELTNFNRCDYFKWFDNTNPVNRTLAYTCYAYLVVDGEAVYLSNPAYVNFFALGNEAVETQN